MKLGIRSRLFLGFGTVITMLALAVGGAAWEGTSASTASQSQAEMATDLGVGAQLSERMLLTRMAAKDYLLSNSDTDVKKFEDQLASVRETLDTAGDKFQSPFRREALATINAELVKYSQAFEQAKAAIRTRNETLDQQGRLGVQVVELIKTALEQADRSGETDVAEHGVIAIENVVLGRYRAYMFANTGETSYFDESNRCMNEAINQLTQMKGKLSESSSDERVDRAIALLNDYTGLTQSVRAAVETRNTEVLTKMDVIGPLVAENTNAIIKSLIDDNTTTAEETRSMLATASTIVMTIGVIGIVVGVGVSILIARAIVRPVSELSTVATKMAGGDFTHLVEWTSNDELGGLAESFNEVIRKNRETLGGISEATVKVERFAGEATETSGRVAQNATNQQEETSRVASAVEEMASSIQEVAQKSNRLTETARKSGEQAKSGGDVVTNTITEINAIANEVSQTKSAIVKLGENGEKISEIIAVINDIADQTNLLALNAAIEAARAGEHGRGFAVVADEVRKLAERTTEATEDVARSIREIQNDTDSAVKLIERSDERTGRGVEMASTAGEALQTIVQDSDALLSLIESIATAVEEQSSVSSELAKAVDGIRLMAEEIAAAADQSASGSMELAGASGDLGSLVGQFRI